jgi:uncharacterized membrane protein
MQRRTLGGLGIVLLAAVASALAAPSLPEQLVTNWDASGTANGSMPRTAALVGGPALALGIVVLFEAIPRIDPLGGNIAKFSGIYDALAVITTAFVAYIHALVLAWNLGYEFEIIQAMSPAIAVLFVAVGFLLERAERNWFVGIRTPWTLSSEEVWRHTHDRTAPLFKAAGVVALGGLVFPEYFVYLVTGPAVAISVFATLYSYIDYRRVGNGDPASG